MTGTSEYLKQNNVDFWGSSVTQPLKLGGNQSANTAKTFDTKIASLVITTLRLDVDLPSDTEIETMVRDPIKWLNDFKEGKIYRQSSSSGDTLDFQIGTSNASKGTQVWLMGMVQMIQSLESEINVMTSLEELQI
jgi:hypothetical protein